jgi:hypothetical protein
MIWRAQCAEDMYSASHEDSATTVCCFDDQEIGPSAQMTTYPETDLRPSVMAQSESQNEWKTGSALPQLP